MRYQYTIILSLFIFSTTLAQDTTIYFTGFDTPSEQSGWEQFRLGGEMSPFYLWEIQNGNAHSDSNCLAHYYPVAASDTTDDWYVSPAFLFEAGGVVDSIWTAYAGFGTPMAGDTIALYLLTGNKDPELASEQTLLHLFSDTNTYQNDNTWRKTSDILIPETQDSAYIAFRYTTENNWLDVRFDDIGLRQFNIADTSDTAIIDGIAEERTVTFDFQLYPNPSSGMVSLNIDTDLPAQVQVMDALGNTVYLTRTSKNMALPQQLSAGLYFVSVRVNETSQTQKLIMQ